MPKTIRMPKMDKWSKVKTITTGEGKKRFVLRNVVSSQASALSKQTSWRKRGFNARILGSQSTKQNPKVPRQKGKHGIYTSAKKVKCPEFRTNQIKHRSSRPKRNTKKLPKGKQKNIYGVTVGRIGTNTKKKVRTGTKTKAKGIKTNLNQIIKRSENKRRTKKLKKLLK